MKAYLFPSRSSVGKSTRGVSTRQDIKGLHIKIFVSKILFPSKTYKFSTIHISCSLELKQCFGVNLGQSFSHTFAPKIDGRIRPCYGSGSNSDVANNSKNVTLSLHVRSIKFKKNFARPKVFQRPAWMHKLSGCFTLRNLLFHHRPDEVQGLLHRTDITSKNMTNLSGTSGRQKQTQE